MYQSQTLEILEAIIVRAMGPIMIALEEFEKVQLHWILKYQLMNFQKKIYALLVKLLKTMNYIEMLWHLNTQK